MQAHVCDAFAFLFIPQVENEREEERRKTHTCADRESERECIYTLYLENNVDR